LQVLERFGGAGRDRTGDLIVANDALSQLSYSPMNKMNCWLANSFYQRSFFRTTMGTASVPAAIHQHCDPP
jgi:hypothetical protein